MAFPNGILEISELMDYNSANHFSRTFKRIYGISHQKYKINNSISNDNSF